MKHLPLGIQHFDVLRESNKIYVDKTELIYSLIESEGVYFLSRPRRFGKSLLLSTMEQIARGRKDLFRGLWIEDKWDWDKRFPVIMISLTSVSYQEMGLKNGLIHSLLTIFKTFHIEPTQKEDLKSLFIQLLTDIHAKHGKIVLLIDEYDKPVIDYLEQETLDTAKANQKVMKNFYSCLKDHGDLIHTLFITGVSKFPKVSIFSELNHLDDLTLDPAYVNLCGYTQDELESYFEDHVQYFLTKNKNYTKQNLLDDIKRWYDGFSWDGVNRVYNPFSIIHFFKKNVFDNYWFESGTPTFLLKLIFNETEFNFENKVINYSAIKQYDIENLELMPLLFQTGYLTLVEKVQDDIAVLDYPNREVRNSFYDFLIKHLGDSKGQGNVIRHQLKRAFQNNDLGLVEKLCNQLFANLPYDFFRAKEVAVHCLIHIYFKYLGMEIESEVHTQQGRLDAVVQTPTHVFIFEFKINQSADVALEQIQTKNYAAKFQHLDKTLIGIGANFVTDKRAFDAWKVVSF